MRELTIAMALIEQGGNYILQRRGSNPQIGAAGLLGCFGGKIEVGETAAQAVARELTEETTINEHESSYTYLGLVEVLSDHKEIPTAIHGHSFSLVLADEVKVEALEGELVSLGFGEVEATLNQMTPGTRAIFEQFVIGRHA